MAGSEVIFEIGLGQRPDGQKGITMKDSFYYSASRITVDGYDNGDVIHGYFDSIQEARKEIRRQLKESYCLARHSITAEVQCFHSGLCGNYTPDIKTITVARPLLNQGGIALKYIAYGSNMVREQMAFRCPDARLIGTGTIDHARLEFYLHATVEHTASESDRVPVAVWEISAADEKRLDRYEGFPNYYIKEEWPVTLSDGSQITGMIYLMKLIRNSPPQKSYYDGIRDAYEQLDLSSEIKTVLEPALRRSLRR